MQILQLRKEAWKIQDFNVIWTNDLAIPVRRSNQLSNKATDVGSWSFVGSNVPVRNESMMKWYMKWIIYELRIWNHVKLWSSQLWMQFLQLCKEAWKIQVSQGHGFKPLWSPAFFRLLYTTEKIALITARIIALLDKIKMLVIFYKACLFIAVSSEVFNHSTLY